MPPVLMKGKRVGQYTIEALLSKGNNAISYKARGPAGVVFFKLYKMPTVATPWYKAYISHQEAIKKRVEETRMKHYSYRFIEFFEHDIGIPCYFQVFEFAENGKSLAETLATLPASSVKSWEQRLILAKVFTAGLAAMHEAGIVHTDLKPDNVQLFHAPHIDLGYTLKLIDVDFAILVDRKPPWHGDGAFGFVGTPGYRSPEHLAGKVPIPASDVFTAGLMLYELLAGSHPYPSDTEEEYAATVRNYRAKAPVFLGKILLSGEDKEVGDIILRCLHPDSAKRPGIMDVNMALKGVERPKPISESLTLKGPMGRLSTTLSMTLGKGSVRTITAETDFWAAEQCLLKKTPTGWTLAPCPAAPNETLLNGKAIKTAALLKAGDVVAIGREAKGIAKSPLTVEFE